MSIVMRPRFTLDVGLTLEQVVERLEAEAAEPGCVCRVELFYDTQVEIRIIKEHHHTWSPQLVLFLEERDGRTSMRGKFGPDGHIWTMFMAGYATAGMIALGGFFLLSSQMMLKGQERSGVWLIAAGVVVSVLVYLLAQVGQRLATPQMELIHALICRSFPDDCTWS